MPGWNPGATGITGTVDAGQVLVGTAAHVSAPVVADTSSRFTWDDDDGLMFAGDPALSTFGAERVAVELCPPAFAGRQRALRVAPGALTAMAGVELVGVELVPPDLQFTSGVTLALQRCAVITGPTLSATGAKEITEAVTLAITAPTKGANVSWGRVDSRDLCFALKLTGGGGLHITPSGSGQVGAGFDCCYPASAVLGLATNVDYSAFVLGTDTSNNNIQWAAGATVPSPFRWMRISRPSLGRAAGGGSVAVAATVAIAGPPTTPGGSGFTFGNAYSLWVESGPCGFQAISATAVSTNLIEDTDGTDYIVFNSGSNYLDIGNVPGTGFEGDTPITMSCSGPSQVAVKVATNSTNGFSGFLFNDSSDNSQGMVGFGNSASVSPFTNRMHLRWGIVAGNDFVFLRGSTATAVGICSGSSTTGDLARFVWGDATLNAGFTFEIHQPVYPTGSPTAFRVSGAAHTTLSNAEASDVILNLARTVQFGQNASLATQRAVQVTAPTYSSSVATKTITDAVTLDVSAAPTAGANVTLTNAYALRVQAGMTRLNGGLRVDGNFGFGVAPAAVENVTGSRGGNAALADLLTKLANKGIITDGTSA